MARAAAVPLEIRAPVAWGLRPVTAALAVAALGIAGAALFALAMDRLALGYQDAIANLGFATRVAVVASLTLGYTVGIWLWTVREQHRDLAELGIEAEGVDLAEDPASLYRTPPEDLRRSRLAGLAGLAFFVSTIELPGLVLGGSPGEAWSSIHPLSYMLLLGLLFFWLIGRVAYFSIARSQLAQPLEKLRVDLLDRRPLRVFGRMALRNAFIWVAGSSLAALAFLNPEIRIHEALLVLVPVSLGALLIGTAAMLLPMRGIHARMVEAKAAELARVEGAIRGEADALVGSRIADRAPPPSLADLIAYRDLVEATPEWPLDASSFRRLGLYLLIPIGSWIGGALMERAIGTLLD